ncbi:MAG: hypothetical protein NZM11_03665 [Anaerolineales bacterium]|nr:hypothetical protein [Anaerolineales bacterium]
MTSARIDAKGKIFTDIVRKERVPVLIQTPTHTLHGYIFLRPEERVKDALNETNEQFIAMADAEVYTLDGHLRQRVEFLTVNKAHIIWLRPDPASPPASDINANQR